MTIAQTPGTRLQAAQLNDDRYLPEFEKLFDEQKKRKAAPARPPIEGFDRTVEAIYDLSDDIRLLIQVLTKVDLKFRPRPETPFDRMKERKKAATLARIEKLLE